MSPLITLVQAAALGAPPSSQSRGLAFGQSNADAMAGAAKRPATDSVCSVDIRRPEIEVVHVEALRCEEQGWTFLLLYRASPQFLAGVPQGPAVSAAAAAVMLTVTPLSHGGEKSTGSHEVEFEQDVRPCRMLALRLTRRSSPTCREAQGLRFNGRRSKRQFSRNRRFVSESAAGVRP